MSEVLSWAYVWLIGLVGFVGIYLLVVLIKSHFDKSNPRVIGAADQLIALAQKVDSTAKPSDIMRVFTDARLGKSQMITAIKLSALRLQQNGMNVRGARVYVRELSDIVHINY